MARLLTSGLEHRQMRKIDGSGRYCPLPGRSIDSTDLLGGDGIRSAHLVLTGLVFVVALALHSFTASMMASLLYVVRPHDPAVFLIVPISQAGLSVAIVSH